MDIEENGSYLRMEELQQTPGKKTNRYKVSLENRKIFRVALNMYYDSRTKIPLAHVYQRMIQAFYTVGTESFNGIKAPVLMPKGHLPSLSQFRYWVNRNISLTRDFEKMVKSRAQSHRN